MPTIPQTGDNSSVTLLFALLLLSGGLAASLRDELARPVAYLTKDIARRLQLRAVPSVVVERDNQLVIREVSLGRPR